MRVVDSLLIKDNKPITEISLIRLIVVAVVIVPRANDDNMYSSLSNVHLRTECAKKKRAQVIVPRAENDNMYSSLYNVHLTAEQHFAKKKRAR